MAVPATAQSFADYPRTKIEYYTVSATNPRDLRRQIRNRGPGDSGGGTVTARAFYTFKWTLRTNGPKRCKARLTIDSKVIFPKHSNPNGLSPELRADWERFIRELERHEMQHIRLAYRALPKLRAALENGHCKSAYNRAAKVEAALNRQQRAFDAGPEGAVAHGMLFP
ncbi:MAG: DUF922 domain-containing protein [Pseudomonadota bacterium]